MRRGPSPAGLAWVLWALFVVGMVLVAWLDELLRQAGRPELVQWNAENAIYAVLGLVSAATAGATLAVAAVFQPTRASLWLRPPNQRLT